MRRSTLWPSQVSAHGINVLLRRTQTQTATRHSDSLPVQELVFCGLPMTLSATTNSDFILGNGWPEHAESVPSGMHAA